MYSPEKEKYVWAMVFSLTCKTKKHREMAMLFDDSGR